ncbi:MAG: DUF2334 domain-containing protein [Candidatus Methanofastidiosa archaeon]|nr:DUF2334 domain-containing protein [Candidatus Methanofastidiosa archaeon]
MVSFYLYTSNVQRYFSPFSSYEDPLETKFEYFSLGRYPDAHEGVSLLTFDDVSYATSANDVMKVKEITDTYGAKSTYFIIPRYGGEGNTLSSNGDLVSYLSYCLSTGDEMALHGYTHYPTEELKGKSYEEQLELIDKGKEDLNVLFGPIYGFRPPSFWKNSNTYKALASEDFLYCSSASIFNVFPYHPKEFFHPFFGDDIDIIEVPCFPEDYFWDVTSENFSTLYFELITRFESCQKKGTAFVVFTHLPRLVNLDEATGRYEALEMLENYLEYTSENDIWMPTMREYTEWHIMFLELEINCRESLNELILTIDSQKDISGLTFFFDLPDVIDTVYIYHNGDMIYQNDDCASDEIIII